MKHRHEYNPDSVDKAIRQSRQPISAREARLIHALLKGREPRANWIICNTYAPELAWNADAQEWDEDTFTKYTDSQKARTTLPPEGYWQER